MAEIMAATKMETMAEIILTMETTETITEIKDQAA